MITTFLTGVGLGAQSQPDPYDDAMAGPNRAVILAGIRSGLRR